MARQARHFESDRGTKNDFLEFQRATKEEINKSIERLEKSQQEWSKLFVEHTKSSIALLAEDIKVSEARYMLESKKAEARLASDRVAMETRLENDRKESEARLDRERERSDKLIAEERKESKAARRALNANFIAIIALVITVLGLALSVLATNGNIASLIERGGA